MKVKEKRSGRMKENDEGKEDGQEDEEEEEELEEQEDEVKEEEEEEEVNDQGAGETTTPPTGEENKAKNADDGASDPATASLGDLGIPKAEPLHNKKENPFLPYLPLAPSILGISIMSYLLWKYFGMLRQTRKRYRRAPQIRGPSLEQQIVDHVQQPGPREYYIVKEQVLNECQKGELHSTKEDYFTILVQEFMGSEFIKEENILNEEDVQSSNSGFREEDSVPKEDVLQEQVPGSKFKFRV
ncbi:SICA antigen [Plasmodium coatneyi]|uniref:SICA antigen n=1 Tax=Plasmodium coatneyi TaxID=208452 RepID=A0A1B1E0N8_9APIC|nr:SICA antigen [Plasmodium coatneyi]ANQ08455.1 SICA antigen [Plasmodium coatneyi]